MGFEQPILLAALGLMAAPILAHMLKSREVARVTLPTVALLARAKADDSHRRRIVDRLLLIVRILCAAVLALALAQPFTLSTSSSSGGPEAVAIVLDDSMSMSAEQDGRSLLQRAASEAGTLVDGLNPLSEVTLVLGGDPPRTMLAASRDRRAVASALENVGNETVRGDALCRAASRASAQLHDSDRTRRRLVVVSDFANDLPKCDWPDDPKTFVPVRGEGWKNVSVESIDVTLPVSSKNVVTATVRLSGEQQDGYVEVFQRGGRIGREPIEWSEQGGAATLEIAARKTDDPAAQLRIDVNDGMGADNTAGFLLRPSSAVHVLLILPERGAWENPRYVETALVASSTPESPFVVRRVSTDVLRARALSWADVVILSNVALREESLVTALRGFVSEGGGLWVAPGDDIQPRRYAASFGDLLPARYTMKQTVAPTRVRGNDFAHLRAGKTTALMRLEPTAAAVAAQTLLRFDDSTPALMVKPWRTGQVAMMAFSLDDAWTDLPYQPAFVPFVSSMVTRLAGAPKRRLAPFEHVTLPGSSAGQKTQVVLPSGAVVTLEEGARVRFEQTSELGAYRVVMNGVNAPRFAFVVAARRAESQPVFGVLNFEDTGSDAQSSKELASYRVSRVPVLLLLLAALVAIEGALRHGSLFRAT